MKKLLQKLFIAFLFVFSFTSCSEDGEVVKSSEDISLSAVNHQEQWVQKFTQLESQSLSSEHLILIREMKSLMIDYSSKNNERLLDIGLALSKITSENDFEAMFCTTEPYKITSARKASNKENSTATFAESKLLEAKEQFKAELEVQNNP